MTHHSANELHRFGDVFAECDEAMRCVVETAARVVGASYVEIAVWTPQGRRVFAVIDGAGVDQRLCDIFCEQLTATAGAQSVPDPAADPRFRSAIDPGAAVVTGSLAGAPIALETDAGDAALILAFTKPRTLQDADLKSLQSLANLASEQLRLQATMMRQQRRLAELNALATRDPLTGLLNRRAAEERYAEICASRAPGEQIAAALVDIDRFKHLNDSEGHDAGDALLICLADLLLSTAGADATVSRLGGDEFLVMRAAPADQEAGGGLAAAIQAAFERSRDAMGLPSMVSLSIGVAEFCPETTSFTEALKFADLGLFEAKRQGRGRAVAYTSDLGAANRQRAAQLREVEGALLSSEFLPYYQPQIDLKSGALAGFEALARWRRPCGELLAPADFSCALEDPELGARISNVILEKSLRCAGAWRRAGLEFGGMSLNVTARQILEDGFGERLDWILSKNALHHNDLTLELTENILLSRESGAVHARLSSLRDRGVRIALDDFGTGYASLSHLRELPIDQLKLDRSFIGKVTQSRQNLSIVVSLLMLARTLGIQTVAEGIEEEGARRLLSYTTCQIGQGYLFSRPVCEEEAELLCPMNSETAPWPAQYPPFTPPLSVNA